MQATRHLPIAEWLTQYDRSWFRADLVTGLTVRALGISSALGGLLQGCITSGGASQSAANDWAAARTQM